MMRLTSVDLLVIERELCRRSLAQFAKRAWSILEPATELKWGWAVDAICDHLEAVTRGDIRRLLINVPPGPMRVDSIVETGRGQVRLDQVRVGDIVLTHRGRYRAVEAVHDQGVLPILKITTHSGRETFAAPSHPYLTPNGWVEAGLLKNGDILAVVNRQEDRPNAETMSADEARFLGYIVGDGSVTHSPSFVNGDFSVIEDFIRCAEALGFITSVRQSNGHSFWKVGIKGAREFLTKHNLLGKNSYTKRIPPAVMASTAEAIANFLGAYWTCDGGIDVRCTSARGSRHRAYATTVGELLASDLVQALALVGVESRLRRKSRNLTTSRQPGGVYFSFSIEVQNKAMTARVLRLPGLCAAKQAQGEGCAIDFDRPLWDDPIVSIEHQEDAHCMCLTVDEDHSFTCSGIAVKNTMKSLLTSVIWPAWEWGPMGMPEKRYLGTAHKQDLAVRDNTKCRRLIQSDWYRRLWPIELTGDQNAKTKFENSKTGFREAMAFGSMTGSRGDCLLAGSMVKTEYGPVAIENIVVGAKPCYVLSYDNDSNQLVYRPIQAVARRSSPDFYRVHFTDGSLVECTGDHLFYTSRGYVSARLLSEGDTCLRVLQEGGYQDCRGNAKGYQEQQSIRGLLKPLRTDTDELGRGEVGKELQDLRKQGTEQEFLVLRAGMQSGVCKELQEATGDQKIAEADNVLPYMQHRDCAEGFDHSEKILQRGLQERCSFSSDAWREQPGMAQRNERAKIHESVASTIPQVAPEDNSARWMQVRGVQCGQGFVCAPHRHGPFEQCVEKPSYDVPSVPCDPSLEGQIIVKSTNVAVVERICEPAEVYDIQVEGTRCFFANGILVHNCIILDDPHSVDDANSRVKLASDVMTFREALPSRVNNDDSAIVIIMQRLAVGDVADVAIELGYDQLIIPMRFESGRSRWIVGNGDPRQADGELMFPERFSAAKVAELENSLGSHAVAGQLQQRPNPRGGRIMKTEWFHLHDNLPVIDYRIIYADTAQKTAERNDYSVFECWGKGKDGKAYLLDLIRGKWEAPELERRAIAFWQKHQAEDIAKFGQLRQMKIEDKASGTGLIQGLKLKAQMPVAGIQRVKDKYTRLLDIVGYIEAGQVSLPQNAPFVNDFVSECESFSADDTHAHDDQVDPMIDAINDMLASSSAINIWERMI